MCTLYSCWLHWFPQLCSGVDENAIGTCAELVFAPIDASFSDDAPLLPSGFRIIPIESGVVNFCLHWYNLDEFLELKDVYVQRVALWSVKGILLLRKESTSPLNGVKMVECFEEIWWRWSPMNISYPPNFIKEFNWEASEMFSAVEFFDVISHNSQLIFFGEFGLQRSPPPNLIQKFNHLPLEHPKSVLFLKEWCP